jgi:hypothetical protein
MVNMNHMLSCLTLGHVPDLKGQPYIFFSLEPPAWNLRVGLPYKRKATRKSRGTRFYPKAPYPIGSTILYILVSFELPKDSSILFIMELILYLFILNNQIFYQIYNPFML